VRVIIKVAYPVMGNTPPTAAAVDTIPPTLKWENREDADVAILAQSDGKTLVLRPYDTCIIVPIHDDSTMIDIGKVMGFRFSSDTKNIRQDPTSIFWVRWRNGEWSKNQREITPGIFNEIHTCKSPGLTNAQISKIVQEENTKKSRAHAYIAAIADAKTEEETQRKLNRGTRLQEIADVVKQRHASGGGGGGRLRLRRR
jgi:hypothetical protein